MNRNSEEVTGMKLDDEAVRSLRQARVLREFELGINHLDFSPNAEWLVGSGEDDQIVVYGCDTGLKKNVIFSKKYGVDLVQFAPRSKSSAIYASTKIDDTLRYLSLVDNKYIRYFKGHGKRVCGLHMSPRDGCFLSASLDRTVRLWDLRNNNAVHTLQINGRPFVSYDPEGAIFAAFPTVDSISLFDARFLSKGPFKSVPHGITSKSVEDITGIKFSPHGRHIMLISKNQIHVFDAFTGTKLNLNLSGHANRSGVPLEASYSPDSQFIFCGSTDGRVHVWNAQKGYKVCVLKADSSSDPIRCVKFSPKHMLLATGCSVVSLWFPDVRELSNFEDEDEELVMNE
ncbi:unnamed protein product [Notodromas monacha]|nr:unnamed protein product [Notodromas monacha]CAG0917629.1 unnamed protein product [Notodromas monacha]